MTGMGALDSLVWGEGQAGSLLGAEEFVSSHGMEARKPVTTSVAGDAWTFRLHSP